jgi:hypothetical protein
MNGYIKLHRRLLDSDVFKKSKAEDLKLWIYILLKASHKTYAFNFKVNGSRKSVVIGPGSFVAGRQKIAEETGVSESKIRRFLEAKKSTRKLTIKTTKQYSVITICKYKEYQLEDLEDDQGIDQESGHIQEVKEVTTNVVTNIVRKSAAEKDPDFDIWWTKYRKSSEDPEGSKKAAAFKFATCRKSFSVDQINLATRHYIIECRRTNTTTKHAENFLNPKNNLIEQYQDEPSVNSTHGSAVDSELTRIHGRPEISGTPPGAESLRN